MIYFTREINGARQKKKGSTLPTHASNALYVATRSSCAANIVPIKSDVDIDDSLSRISSDRQRAPLVRSGASSATRSRWSFVFPPPASSSFPFPPPPPPQPAVVVDVVVFVDDEEVVVMSMVCPMLLSSGGIASASRWW